MEEPNAATYRVAPFEVTAIPSGCARLFSFSGLGIGALPDYVVNENPDLVNVLTELKGPKVDVFFVYPEELRNSKRVAVFRDFLLARLAEIH